MRKLIIVMLLFTALLQACGGGEHVIKEENLNEGDTTASKANALSNEEMVQIDSSVYVMFPLRLSTKTISESGGSSSSGSERDVSTYWNIAFYNTLSNSRRLLTDEQMIITDYGGPEISGSEDAAIVPNPPRLLANSLIFYKVICSDYDEDGKLTENDPQYLFVSNLAGENFKQVSPDKVSITDWHLMKKTGMLLMEGRTDTNHDNKFDSNDKVTTYIYDLNTGKPAAPVFSPDFNDETYKLMKKLWPPAKQK